MRSLNLAVTEGYWTNLLEAFYTGLEGRDVSGYAWHTSDGWTQSRHATKWTKHLECWVDLGGELSRSGAAFEHQASLAFSLRYKPDDDSVSQARMHAAIRDAAEFLARVQLPHGCRVTDITGAQIDGPFPSGFVEAVVRFTLHVPR